MKAKFKGIISLILMMLISFSFVACDSMCKNSNCLAEKIELTKATLAEVEFENADTVKINRENDTYTISGTINAMSNSQKTAFGVEDVTHTVVLKFTFDKKKTISSFKIQGSTTKVFSDDSNVENYVGSISDLLDSEENEDAFCYLILSANTTEYSLTSIYTDKTSCTLKVKINATLATATID